MIIHKKFFYDLQRVIFVSSKIFPEASAIGFVLGFIKISYRTFSGP
ncbi:hypothetical protein EU92_0161 [Prochlorococcus marinus str. MIT 9107]|uniref:Uncharacterized protein n=1 Tax=Prochlorococcus marinus str. MIT 9116 TaxID=167544 RepID=A0A0A1ZY23_PROMR|nr:hypothetical protein EU92_0161 [Prochlorococcus marinus str. MIT 9107]KGF93491.1 hypothetical protein EU93_0120 [Prochlorococcus marinus str. MIT 9116]KGF94096.1 hypothetical protein EU94_1002 [Prochlorococcus marinus str. MIT 9123]